MDSKEERVHHLEVDLDEDDGEYLSRCQVDTPPKIVDLTWRLVNDRRPDVDSVVDFGCGDARFASAGKWGSYVGYEIDPKRAPKSRLPCGASFQVADAFGVSSLAGCFSACVGNPPYVRHHDLGGAWLAKTESRLSQIDGYVSDGRSNAYVYFMWLALDCVAANGLVAMVVPYEWSSRPASAALRKFISDKRWGVDIYHLHEAGFERVLTTACIAIIDKASKTGRWKFHDVAPDLSTRPLRSVTRSSERRLDYEEAATGTRAHRGLSPGGQEAFVLTEEKRIHFRLERGRDVVPAVTSFRHLESKQATLSESLFRENYINAGKPCWLLNTAADPSAALGVYLATIGESIRANYTCSARREWWRFPMPRPPHILYASGFKSTVAPKMFRNDIGAIHVGGIHGIYCERAGMVKSVFDRLSEMDLSSRVVPLSNGFLKLEVHQMNSILNALVHELQGNSQ
ncbi:class I SAM-dependent methyltransferase [Variovorax boronicumulans]|nr:class I SAM-dependent methyltransferase [Variovorax boronicumulans]